MTAGSSTWPWSVGLLLLATIPGGLCGDGYNIGGFLAAVFVAIILLVIFIVMLVAGFVWNGWFPRVQWARGKVKMPRAYWKKRKMARLRMVHGTRGGLPSEGGPSLSLSGLPQDHLATTAQDKGSLKASWIQGGNTTFSTDDGRYEEMAVAMDLGEEKDEEFRIETTVTDEVLDLGPSQPSVTPDATPVNTEAGPGMQAGTSSVQTATVEQTEEPVDDGHLESSVDSSTPSVSQSSGHESTQDGPAAASEQVTSFSGKDPSLVAL